MSSYERLNVPRLGLNAGNERVPRLQRSAIVEFGEMLSAQVAAGDWLNDGGTAINGAGQDVEQYLDSLIATRPHWEVPADVVDEADDTWTSGSLSKQGERWRKLRSHLGSDAATNAAMAAEAAVYGVKPGTTQKGVKPGEQSADDTKAAPGGGPNNPWSDKFAGTEVERAAKMASIIKQGTKFAASMAASAGKTITGAPLKR